MLLLFLEGLQGNVNQAIGLLASNTLHSAARFKGLSWFFQEVSQLLNWALENRC